MSLEKDIKDPKFNAGAAFGVDLVRVSILLTMKMQGSESLSALEIEQILKGIAKNIKEEL